jgi:hypothetical protein
MTHTFRRPVGLTFAASCLAALTISLSANNAAPQEGLDALLVRYDRQLEGPAKDKLAAQIDAVAHQKYATVSRLYWYTDLALAKSAARKSGRPILHLRMLGNLDHDLSCTNSRLFRATVYANHEMSRFLRERFILHWSSERPVPRVIIDYGDGRTLEQTTTGNSGHYVLDDNGNVLDVLPGLYAPLVFRRELEESLALAERVRGKSDDERAKSLVDYHQQRLMAAKRDWEGLARTAWIPGAGPLPTQTRLESQLVAAQRATATKMAIERPVLRQFAPGLTPEALSEDHIEMWSAAGQVLYGIGNPKIVTLTPVRVAPRSELTTQPSGLRPPPRVLDEASRALVVRLHNGVPHELRSTPTQLDAIIARLEQTIVGDTALNQLRLRPQIGREIVRRQGRIDFATLNAWIYAEVFRTPKQDPWLGLLPRDVFTGLVGDGVVIR